jgi:hypothetical protein
LWWRVVVGVVALILLEMVVEAVEPVVLELERVFL